MADSNIPFSIVANTWFKNLLTFISPNSTTFLLPKHGNTARSWLNSYYKELYQSIKAEIYNTPYKIYISFNLWTYGALAIMAIVSYFLDLTNIY